ncbi:hypothetical protein Pla22_38250 [Rubripirellula amarantea]|uniref:Uncharacterized protein n=1 Tax=Rubripirellula amarantea TaxID=2527999 RepID=A0A5C5WLP0_9BACT|nr:hypothetical protein [Rubripirellula amarantea]TWT51049.1 hypothetical protein Pla22_38250 [Rubripirellula amarantea]
MRFETQQADPGSNLQGFSMFFDVAHVADKRRVSGRPKQSAPTYYLCRLADTLPAVGRQNEETPRGKPRRW